MFTECQTVLQARNREEFRTEVIRFSQDLEFDTVAAMLVIDHQLGNSDFIVVDNTPAAYAATFHSISANLHDPVMQHCKYRSTPIAWDQSTYTERGQGEKWEIQAEYGFCNGIAIAMHLPNDRHFFLGVDRISRLPSDAHSLAYIIGRLQLFAVHALEAGLRLLPQELAPSPLPTLTPREIEALSWTMEGKTAWEVGRILGISERTAVLHVSNAMHKLNCGNKHQAVLRAMRLGILG